MRRVLAGFLYRLSLLSLLISSGALLYIVYQAIDGSALLARLAAGEEKAVVATCFVGGGIASFLFGAAAAICQGKSSR